MSGTLIRSARRIVWLCSFFVPTLERKRWSQEWNAEIAYRTAARLTASQAALLLFRVAGSLPHALWLAKQQWSWDLLTQDFRFAVRTLCKHPLFVTAAALTLAVGIGANTALFSVIDAVLLRPLPYPAPERLVFLYESQLSLGGTRDFPSPGNIIDWQRESQTLSGVAAWWVESTTIVGDDYADTEQVPSAKVTSDFFPVLGVEPIIGRTFAPEEVRAQPTIAVLSYELWQRRFGGDTSVVGSDVPFKNESWRIVGVMPKGFRTPGTLEGEVQLFKPWDLEHQYGSMPGRARDHRFLRGVARLAPRVTRSQAQAELDVIAAAIAEENPKTNTGWGVTLVPLRDAIVGDTRLALAVLLGAVGFVLLLACANVTSLLLVRASGRAREMALRTALGASRLRLVRQLFLESFLLAAIGGLAGVAIATASVQVLVRLAPEGIPRIDEVALDTRVLVFAIVASLLAGLIAGVAPAFHGSTAAPSSTLSSATGTVSTGPRRQRLRAIIVALEIAAAVMLLAGSGLLLRSFSRVLAVDLGFDADQLLVVRMRLDGRVYGRGGAHPYYTQFLEEIRALPGVVAAGGTTGLPMDELDIDFDRPFWRQGEPRPDGGGAGVQIRMATTGYFEAMRIPLVQGREVDVRDDRTKPRVAIVNQTMAVGAWPHESPIGKRLYIDYQNYETVYEVVGVVGDTRFYGHKKEPRRAVYIPHAQNPYLPLNIVVRAESDPASLATAIRQKALELDSSQPVHSIRTMSTLMGSHLGQDRFAAFLMTAFAGMALLLATIGIYSVVAFAVSQRQRELGLRLALGAESGDLTRLVLGAGFRIAALGAFIGVGGTMIASRYLEGLLFGVSATDPWALFAAASLLLGTVLLACYLPARRASKVDPITSLRYG